MNYTKREREELFYNTFWNQRLEWVNERIQSRKIVSDRDYFNFEASISFDMFICSINTVIRHLRSLNYKVRMKDNMIYFKRKYGVES